jgi:hypothetical protein
MLVLTIFSGCEKPEDISPIQYNVIGQGDLFDSGREGFDRQNFVIRDNKKWQNLVNQMNINNNVSETFTETEINFSEYMIIAVFDKVKGNGGWTIDITKIENHKSKNAVTVTNLSTGNVADVITQPYQIVKIPISHKRIVFETFYKKTGE